MARFKRRSWRSSSSSRSSWKTGSAPAVPLAQAVAQAPADGYTLLFVASPFTTVAAATPLTANYDPIKRFAPVALIAAGPLVWVANAQAPFRQRCAR